MDKVRQLLVWVVVFFFMTGCGDVDLLRFDKMGKPEGWEPNFSLPLAHASFSVWDAFNQGDLDSATLKKDNNGQLYFEYKKPDIYTLEVDSIYRMHLEDMFFNFNFPILPGHFQGSPGTAGYPPYDTVQMYYLENIPEGVYLEDAIVSMKSMGVTIVNNARIGGRLKVTCANLYTLQPVGVISFTIDFTANDRSKMFYTELPSVQAIMGRKHVVPVEVSLNVTDISEAKMGENVMIEMSATGVSNKSVNLLLPEQELQVDEGAFKPDIPLLNELSGKFCFTRPELCLNARTKGMGMNLRLDGMKFVATNGKERVTLQKNDGSFLFAGNSENQYYKDNLLYYTVENSNITDWAALPPRDSVIYSGGKVKCGGEVVSLSAGGQMKLDLSMRFPLEMSATELEYRDTIADLNMKDSDKVKQATLKIMGNNGLKMGVQVADLELLDEDRRYLDQIENKNSSGFGAATDQGPTSGVIGIELTESNLRNLSKTKYIVLKLLLKTPNGTNVNINDGARFDLKFLLDAKVDMGEVVN